MASFLAEQYEAYPYPHRDPEEERGDRRTLMGDFRQIAFYKNAGSMRFKEDFRILVAGGGTGDATIHLARELKKYCPKGSLLQLDLSSASLEIAKKRAEKLGLDNVTFVQDTLLDLPKGKHGTFDYINCSGVLHHLEDPIAGAKALSSVLKTDGMVSIMLYGLYGRRGVYDTQHVMKVIQGENDTLDDVIPYARDWLKALPETNFFRNQRRRANIPPSEIVDTYLHVRDRAYTVPQVYELCDEADLQVVTFIPPIRYDIAAMMPECGLKERIKKLSSRKQQEVAEILDGAIARHMFYATKSGEAILAQPDPNDMRFVPFLTDIGRNIRGQLGGNTNATLPPNETRLKPMHISILRQVDGEKTIQEVLDSAASNINREMDDIKNAWLELYEVLNIRAALMLCKF